MYSFLDYQFWLYFLYTYCAIGVSIFLPGYLVVSRFFPIKSKILLAILAIVAGWVAWAMQGYIFGYAGVRSFTYLYMGVSVLLTIVQWRFLKEDIRALVQEVKTFDRLALILIVLGVIVQVYPVFGSGMKYEDGIRFFHVNGTDGVLQLGYIQSMIRTFPPLEPGISASLVNYHYWSNLAISELARIWNIPVIHLFFQYIPPLIAGITAVALYFVIQTFGGSKNAVRWGLFLLFLSGDAAYFIILLLHQFLSFRSPALDNGALQFLNMPHVFAKMIFITSLIPLYYFFKTKEKKWGLFAIILLGSLVGFKVYFGIFAAIGLTTVVGYQIVRSLATIKHTARHTATMVGSLGIFAVISALIYFPPNKSSGGLLFAPLEWPRIFFGVGSFDYDGFFLRRDIYYETGQYFFGILFDGIIIGATLIAIYGTRLLGFWPNHTLYRRIGREMSIFLISGVIIFTILGLFTLQTSGSYNVYNFFAVASIILFIFSAFIVEYIQKKKTVVGIVFVSIFVLLTIPRSVFEIYNSTTLYINSQKSAKTISSQELEALFYLRENSPAGSIIQTHPNNAWDQDAPYTVFFTDTTSYLTGAGLLRTHNQPVEEKIKILKKAFASQSPAEFIGFMNKNAIDYIILQKKDDQKLNFPLTSREFRVIFENDAVIILTAIKNE